MFKRILVPVDEDPASLAGLRTALALARDQNARLRLVRGLRRVVLGSDAEEVLRSASVPVLLTRR